jgi:hypothetical protein
MRQTSISGNRRLPRITLSLLMLAIAATFLAGCAPKTVEKPAVAGSPAPQKTLKDMTILELQDECLAYSAPADQVVVEQDSTAAETLLKQHPTEYHDYWEHPFDSGFQNFNLKLTDAGPIAMRIAPPWAALSARVNFRPRYPNYDKGGTIFCGARFTPSGERRLLIIQYVTTPTPYLYFSPSVDLVALVITPAKDAEIPKDYALAHGHGVWVTNVVVPPPLRIYAGQADPADRTHLTFKYELQGRSDMVDVRLADDESIDATPRSPLLKRGWGNAPADSGGMTIRGTPNGGIEVLGP